MDTQEIKNLTEQINREFKQLQDVVNGRLDAETKKYGDGLGETKALVEKINSRIDALELRYQRPGQGDNKTEKETSQKSAKYNAFMKMLRKGVEGLSPEEFKLMTVSDDTTGGFGAPAEMSSEIIKGVVEVSPVRSIVSVRNTSKRSVKVMKRTGTFAAVWTGEIDTRSETDGLRYGLEEIPTHELHAMVDISKQDLEDVDFNLEAELRSEFVEQFALAEAQAVIDGNGVTRAEGFLFNTAVPNEVTGDANLLTYDGLVDVSHNGKEPYVNNGRFVLKLRTLGAIRKMKDGNGDPLWAPFSAGSPATILGFPYTILQQMPSVSAGQKPVAFGDFAKAYRLVDRITIEIERDPYTQANRGAVRFYARKRLGGQVLLAEGIRTLTVSV